MKKNILFTLLVAQMLAHAAGNSTITVQTDQPGVAINHGMWGIFFEDINFGGDGGLYAELVKNRSFEFPDALMGWRILGPTNGVEIRTDEPFSRMQPHYARLQSGTGLVNEGFRGLGVHAGEKYDFSVEARTIFGSPNLEIELVAADGKILAHELLKDLLAGWSLKNATLRPNATDENAKLQVSVVNAGAADLDVISLFPRKTWKNRPGGMRADLVQLLADLKPGFLRFPGGCVVEGNVLTNRYQWKTTIGPVAERKMIVNRWNANGIKSHPAPDYYQTFGIGFFELFQLCEDIGAQPLPVVNCGMACQFNSGEVAPLDQLDTYVQDALDLIEFANGPVTSEWGAKRAALGHPKPFGMKMIGLGNEQWGQNYFDRYPIFVRALKAKYPEIQIVASAGPSPDDERFKSAWPKLRELHADIVDEHSYNKPDWFYQSVNRFDHYDRQGPKVFFGEYAAQSDHTISDNNHNNLECGLAEAAYMTGLERNGDVVRMASYAPLFAHVDGWQWIPDMIWISNLSSYGTVDYYVQKMFANNAGDVTVPLQLAAADGAKLFASATRELASGDLILKVVNASPTPADVKLDFGGASNLAGKATVFTLASDSALAENTFAEPTKVCPQESKIKITVPKFDYIIGANSLTVLRFKTTK